VMVVIPPALTVVVVVALVVVSSWPENPIIYKTVATFVLTAKAAR
jgi:hypothetical protein